MNKVVNERRGAIFDEEENKNPGDASGRSAGKKVPATNSLFVQRSSARK
jgi:hypothetical protein